MGFSGGGSNVLKPHTHDGSIAQDGGALDMDGVTQGSLTAGDLVFRMGQFARLALAEVVKLSLRRVLHHSGQQPQQLDKFN